MFELLGWKRKDWDFVGMRRMAFALSGIFLVIGFAAIVQIARGKAPMGVDFAGGVSMTVMLKEKVDLNLVRKSLEEGGAGGSEVQQVESTQGQRLLIKLRTIEQEQVVSALLLKVAPGGTMLVEGVQSVGPSVGRKLQEQAAWAVLWAIVMIMIYIWARFEYRFGLAAAVATMHDVVVITGVMWLLHKDFTLLTVTALLTLAGYSLTDTVVVYDRIRENRRLHPRDSLPILINRSINEVLSRTIITSVATLFPLVALLVYGSPVTFDFSLALSLGILVGTYSSWFVASPIIIEWEDYRRRVDARAAQHPPAKRN